MYSVEVRDHIMIAHSFRGDIFGPAQKLHGATFVIDATFYSDTLDVNNIVIDIGAAHTVLRDTISPLNYRNLDEVSAFAGQNTTTEFLTKYIFDQLANAARAGTLGRGPNEIVAIKVTLHESHVARAAYEGKV